MSYATLEEWVDFKVVIDNMGIPKRQRFLLNSYIDLKTYSVDSVLEKQIIKSINTMYYGLCFYFKSDAEMRQFMNQKQPCFNHRSCWDILLTSPTHVFKRADIVLGLVDKLYEPIPAKNYPKF